MPVFTGVSVVGGVQGVGNFVGNTSTFIGVDLPGLDLQNRLERVGLLIIAGVNATGRAQTVEVFKLFGNGCFVLPRYPISGLQYNAGIQWFRSGLAWTVNIP